MKKKSDFRARAVEMIVKVGLSPEDISVLLAVATISVDQVPAGILSPFGNWLMSHQSRTGGAMLLVDWRKICGILEAWEAERRSTPGVARTEARAGCSTALQALLRAFFARIEVMLIRGRRT